MRCALAGHGKSVAETVAFVIPRHDESSSRIVMRRPAMGSRPMKCSGRRNRNHNCAAGSANVARFVLCDCPIVAKTAIPTGGAVRIADIAIRYRRLLALSRKRKLFPHFGEPGTAVFAVEEIEYGGHDRPLSFDRYHQFPTLSSLLGYKT
jgi:hypothetical protein